MTIKVHELAKELNLSSKEILEKLNSMGVEAKGHMSTLSDIDAVAVRNIVKRGSMGAETKIVKVAPKKVETIEEPKVIVKAAVIKPHISAEAKTQRPQPRQQEKTIVTKPPAGKPVVPKEFENRIKPPIGKPVAFKESESRPALNLRAEENHAAQDTPLKTPETLEAPKRVDVIAESVPEVKEIAESKEQRSKQDDANSGQEKKAVADGMEKTQQERSAEHVRTEPKAARPEADRPRADQGADRPRYEQRTDRPRAGQGADRPRYEQRTDRPRAGQGADRPRYEQRTDRPGAGQGADRPRYEQRTDRPGGGQGTDRPRYENRSDRPRYEQRADRPKTDQRTDRPQAHTPETKPQKRNEKQPAKHSKDKNYGKNLKGEQEKKGKLPIRERSLEKQVKPKKQQKPKVIAVQPEINLEELPAGTRIVNVPITVAGFCEQAELSTSAVIMSLMRLGIMANINQNIDEDTLLILAEELGINVVIGNVREETVEEGIETFEDREEDLITRPPIITVMGHVDHGKTSLLDAIRTTNVTASESGGITQHIGASEVMINGQKIVFLDTPGHEAFTAMRARGAHVTDIAVLVVAADDSVKPQTIESISHAKAAGVPIIVAINKIDKEAANPDKVKQDLSSHGILVEDWGGDTISVPVSAKTGAGIVNLLEMILLQAEVLELKANPARLASGTVIEARLDKAKGPVATLLVLNGTLQPGMSVVAGTCSGKIRLMTDYKGETIKEAGPATAVEILGLTEVPEAGDEFNAVKEDKMAREIADNRRVKLREEILARDSSTTLEKLFSQIQEGEIKELNLIIKGDVQGSVGAIVASLEKISYENVRVKIIYTGVGTVTESDVMLAETSGAVIIGFNVRPSTAVTSMADRANVEIRTYRVIYDVINDVEAAIKGMLDPEFKEVLLGKVEIRNLFKVPGIGTVGGAYVLDGKIVRNADVRLVRDGIVVHEGKISSLKRFKDDAKEVLQGFECGIGIEKYNDIRENDIIECFKMEEIERK